MWKQTVLTAVFAGMMNGCAIGPHYPNLKKDESPPTAPVSPSGSTQFQLKRYTFQDWLAARKALPNPALVVTMSGGGTRAAALAYETLARLNEVRVPCEGAAVVPNDPNGCTLLDHVIVVAGISGGSFTASQFATQRKKMFDSEVFREKVMKRNLKAAVVSMFVQPWYWPDRTQKLVDVFNDDDLLAHRTYADLMRDARAPFLLLAGSDIASGRAFPLEQDGFDDLCADLGKMEIARGVAAAGSFPYAVNGISLENYHATSGCGLVDENTVTSTDTLAWQAMNPRHDTVLAARARYRLWMRQATPEGWAKSTKYPEFAETPLTRRIQFVHLFDGGLADNLGIRPLAQYLSTPKLLMEMSDKGANAIVIVEINARSDAPTGLAQSRQGPSWALLTENMAAGAIDRVTELSSFVLEDHLAVVFQPPQPASGSKKPSSGRYPAIYVGRVDADLLPLGDNRGTLEIDDSLREAFKTITTFETLNSERLQKIRMMSHRLLDGSACQIYSPSMELLIKGRPTKDRYGELNNSGCSVYDDRFDAPQGNRTIPQLDPPASK